MFWVYIMTNKPYGTLYTGHTDDIQKRSWQHKFADVKSFTKKYKLTRLVYSEAHSTREEAKHREVNIKSWKREWKINLIERANPHWKDLTETMEK